jgi:hypothetical protein
MATQRERDEAKREQKMKDLNEAVDSGSLVIRPMTKDERKDNPPRERPAKRARHTWR